MLLSIISLKLHTEKTKIEKSSLREAHRELPGGARQRWKADELALELSA